MVLSSCFSFASSPLIIGCCTKRCKNTQVAHGTLPGPVRRRQRPILQHAHRQYDLSSDAFLRRASPFTAYELFDREADMEMMENLFNEQPPVDITVICGPVASGKSMLINEFLMHRFPGLWVGVQGKSRDISNPSELARALRQGGNEYLAKAAALAQKGQGILKYFTISDTATSGDGSAAFKKPLDGLLSWFAEDSAATDMNDVTMRLAKVLDLSAYPISSSVTAAKARQQRQQQDSSNAADPAEHYPIIFVDEVNLLMRLYHGTDAQHNHNRTFLNFCVKVCRVEKKAHIIFATSDFSFIDWLGNEIGFGNFRLRIIDDFSADAVDEFVCEYALQLYSKPRSCITDDDLQKIRQVCGGNAGELLRAVAGYNGNWDAALFDIYGPLLQVVKEGLLGGKDFTAEQYASVVRQLLDAPRNILLEHSLIGTVDIEALQAMAASNLIGLRLASVGSRSNDYPELQGANTRLVTAPTPAHLHAMRVVKQQGYLQKFTAASKPAKKQQKQQKTGRRKTAYNKFISQRLSNIPADKQISGKEAMKLAAAEWRAMTAGEKQAFKT